MNIDQILEKIPLADDYEDERNLINIGTDRFSVFSSTNEHKDVVNNNFDKCKMNRLHRAMEVYCWLVLEKDGIFVSERLKEKYPFSQIMPFITTNCHNLKELLLQFKEFENQDFENVFYNMCHLEILRIHWQCKNSTLPLTLVKSLEEVRRTLKELCLSRNQNEKYLGLPDSLALVFPQLITLNKLKLINFEPSQSLVESIGEIKNLVHLRFMCSWLNNHSVFDKTINMYPIGNLQHLETLYIDYDCGVTDEFFINLCNNAKKLKHLDVIGKNITDNGMIALNNLKQLESLKFNLNGLEKNDFITDQSVQCLAYEKCEYLHLSNCTCITNRSVVKLFENLPNLKILYVRNTKVTFKIVTEILELTKYHKKPIFIYVSFEDRDDIFKSLALSDVFFKSNFNNEK
ncbi:uncharacterized protein LOC122849404 [Aphidius gifuensis]|uniref:uncharacterized protein LOC122849404 n=1 Tax=Aphidius gifuensis TaxID=684658 RepID=UPI001CDC7BCF|nr:uncharacterized protein LOC122849404 [Aphidius gifuensis]